MNFVCEVLKKFDSLFWNLPGGYFNNSLNKNQTFGTRVSEVPDSDAQTISTAPRRSLTMQNNIHELCAAGEYQTILDPISSNVQKFSSRRCQGTRHFKGYVDVGAQFPAKNFGKTTWLTYEETWDISVAFGAFLREVGCESQLPNIAYDRNSGSSILIFEDTCAAWPQAAIGAWSQSLAVTTIYGNLGASAVLHALKEGKNKVILCNRKNVKSIIESCADQTNLNYIVYTDWQIPEDEAAIPLKIDIETKGINICSFTEALAQGSKKLLQFPSKVPEPENVALIMYTSGTTSKPKGVIISHRALLAAIAGVTQAVGGCLPECFCHIAYLPLAHIFEVAVEFGCLSLGGHVGYADPKSLSSKLSLPHGAFQEFKPHLFIGVPKIYDTLRKAALLSISKESSAKQRIIEAAFKHKASAIEAKRHTPLFDFLVFRKFKVIVGGRLKLCITGGGPISPDVHSWVRAAFGCPVVNGYGLTETCAAGTIQSPHDTRLGVVGPPAAGIEIKIVSCIDSKGESRALDDCGKPYLCTDTVASRGETVLGRGEICIRGPSLADGYFNMPELTKKSFVNGWFYTGDVGQFLDDGCLQIVDRIKNLVKLLGGEYIALERLELIYGDCEFVDPLRGGIMVYGDGTIDRPIALIQPSQVAVEKWAEAASVKYSSFEELLENPDLLRDALKAFNENWARAKLPTTEKLAAISFVPDAWTPENMCLTATNKLCRHQTIARDKKIIEKLKRSGTRG